MRTFILGLGAALSLALTLAISSPNTARAAEPENPAITGTIQGQLDAFQAQDVETAFTYASPMIQGMFGSSARFGVMVQQGYPMVWNPAEVQYLSLRRERGRLVQRVMIRDLGGALHMLDYFMLEGPDGWLINGVQMVQAGGVGA